MLSSNPLFRFMNLARAADDAAAAAPAAPAAQTAPAAGAAAPGPTEGSSPAAGPSSSNTSEAAGTAATAVGTSPPAASGVPAPSDSKPAAEPKAAEPSLLSAAESKKPAEGEKPAGDVKDPKAAEAAAGEKKPSEAEAKATADAKAAADKVAADAAAAEKAKTEAKDGVKEAVVEKPPARTYDAFKVPDGTKLDDKQVQSFTTILENSELSHQDRAQNLIDMHIAEMNRVAQDAAKQQRDTWNTFQNKLKDEIRSDSELGGNRMETALGIAKSVIEEFGGTDEQVAQTLARLSYTGMGNDVGLARVLHKVGMMLREGDFVPANPPNAKTNVPRTERWYGGGNGAG